MVATAAPRKPPPVAAPASGAGAEARITRQFGLFIGVGYAAYGALTLLYVNINPQPVSGWWTVLAMTMVFAPGIAIGPLAFRNSTRWVKIAANLAVLGFVVATTSWWLAWDGVQQTLGMWFNLFPGLIGITAALSLRGGYPAVVLAYAIAAPTFINNALLPSSIGTLVTISDLLWGFAFSLLFVSGVMVAIRTARLLDSSREAEISEAEQAARAGARSEERLKFHHFIHDEVMITLLEAARQSNPGRVSLLARSTLARLRGIGTEADRDDIALSAQQAVARIREAVQNSSLRDRRTETTHTATTVECDFPEKAVMTIASAAGEAVRNSHRHNGADCRTFVRISISPEVISVDITDDGVGFTPSEVPDGHFGIAIGIRGRMADLDGGEATVGSEPGRGTQVSVLWRRPES